MGMIAGNALYSRKEVVYMQRPSSWRLIRYYFDYRRRLIQRFASTLGLTLLMVLPTCVVAQTRETIVRSPNEHYLALVASYGRQDDPSTESTIKVEMRNHQIVWSKSFRMHNHEHGEQIWKAEWTSNSRFLVFNATLGGGHQPGHLDTYFFDSQDTTLHMLDPDVGIWVTGDFSLIPPDSVRVPVRARLPDGEFSDSLVKTVSLSSLRKPK